MENRKEIRDEIKKDQQKTKDYLNSVNIKENPDQVQCNWCEWKGDENAILFDAATEKEHCPKCKRTGYLMDKSVSEENPC